MKLVCINSTLSLLNTERLLEGKAYYEEARIKTPYGDRVLLVGLNESHPADHFLTEEEDNKLNDEIREGLIRHLKA